MTVEIDEGQTWRLLNLAFILIHSESNAGANEGPGQQYSQVSLPIQYA
jgi:hypothetical protein